MQRILPRAGARPLRVGAGLLVALLALSWVMAACTTPPPSTPPVAATAVLVTSAAPTTAAAGQPTAGAQPAATAAGGASGFDVSKLKTGVDADGHFFRGEANAPIKLIEYSDFQ